MGEGPGFTRAPRLSLRVRAATAAADDSAAHGAEMAPHVSCFPQWGQYASLHEAVTDVTRRLRSDGVGSRRLIPDRFPVVHANCRRVLLRRFPPREKPATPRLL